MSSSGSANPPERLPVNPRRHHVATGQRRRVKAACNSCNVRRTKCSGGLPCEKCEKFSRDCIYPVIEETVTVPRRTYQELLQRLGDLEQRGHASTDQIAHKIEQSGVGPSTRFSEQSPSSSSVAKISPASTEEGMLSDPEGSARYLGESAGATFLNYLRKYLTTVFTVTAQTSLVSPTDGETRFIESVGSYHTHDSRSMPALDIHSSRAPSKDEALVMLSELRYWTQDGAATVESGGLYYWLDIDHELRIYGTEDISSTQASSAVLNAAFAVATLLSPTCTPTWASSHTFYSRARKIIGDPLDASSQDHAPALALLSFYLLSTYRRDLAYTYICFAMQSLISKGTHRASMIYEGTKRMFWTVYNLAAHICCLLGRPLIISDESIKLALPDEARGMPFHFGLRAHVSLSRVSNYIVSHVFDPSGVLGDYRNLSYNVTKSLRLLRDWRQRDLPETLQYVEDRFSQDRSVYELRMAHNQLLILAMRPLLFDAIRKTTAHAILHGTSQYCVLPEGLSFEDCIHAARENIEMSKQVALLREPAILSHTMIHFIFNATITLIICKVLNSNSENNDNHIIAESVAAMSATEGSNTYYGMDCSNVLADLNDIIEHLLVILHTAKAKVVRGDPTVAHTQFDQRPGGESQRPFGFGFMEQQPAYLPFLHGEAQRSESRPSMQSQEQRNQAYSELTSWLHTENNAFASTASTAARASV